MGAFALYAATLVRGVGWDDAGELSVGIDRLGVVHQTGYPLYLLLGKAFTLLEPFGSVATRTNLFSALAAAATVWLTAAFTGRRTGDGIATVVTGFLLATGSVFWSQGRVASIYPAFLLSIALLLTALRWWDQQPGPKRLAAVAGALGLVCVSHKTGIVFLPFVGGFILQRDHRPWANRANLSALAAVFLAPLLSLVYLRARSGYQGFPNQMQHFHGTVWQWMTGTGAGAENAELLGAGLHETASNLVDAVLLVPSQLSIAALFLIPVGLWFARHDALFIWCGLVPAVLISLASATTTGSFGYWYLPALLVGAIAAGYGTAGLRRALPQRRSLKLAATAILILAALTGAAEGIRYAVQQNLAASPWARAALSDLPQQTQVKANWTVYTALRATQALEGLRRNVRLSEGAYTSRSLREAPTPYVAVLSYHTLSAPQGMRLKRVGPRAQTNFKGLTGLDFGGDQLGPPETEALMYEVIGVHRPRGLRSSP